MRKTRKTRVKCRNAVVAMDLITLHGNLNACWSTGGWRKPGCARLLSRRERAQRAIFRYCQAHR